MSTDANGLYYMRQRYYNPETKRFLNQDILTGSIGNSQSLNRYSYVQGNPVSSTDPFGLSPLNMMEGTGLIHGILGLLEWIPGPVGAVASFVDAGIYCFVDHDYGMAALSFVSSVTMGAGCVAKATAGAAKAAKIARTAEYVRTAGTLISNGATFAKSGINLWQDGNKLYQKYKAGEQISTAEAITVGLEAVACAVSGAGMVKEAKNLGKMMKEDNVVGRLKESVGRFGSSVKGLGSQMKATASNLGSQIKGQWQRGKQSFRGESGKYSIWSFASEDLLESHFEKHKNEFKGAYTTADEYLQGARDVINNGYKVEYSYKGETRIGFVQFMGNNSKGQAKFAFVGTNNDGFITTFHTESGKSFWKMLNNGKNIQVINPK